jgi:hypothetical protein
MPESLFDAPVLAAIVAVVVALSKIIEMLLSKAIPKQSILTDEERACLKEIHEVHMRVDQDGTPLVYTPRTFIEIQRDLQRTLQQIVHDQKRIADILDRLLNKLERDK